MKYPITLKGELLNQFGHLSLGYAIAFAFSPIESGLTKWIVIIVLKIGGNWREIEQEKRGKEQPLWIHFLDSDLLLLGAILWYITQIIFNINVDLL